MLHWSSDVQFRTIFFLKATYNSEWRSKKNAYSNRFVISVRYYYQINPLLIEIFNVNFSYFKIY